MTPAQRYYKSIKTDRDDWRNTRPQECMWCGISRCRLDVHEIERRSSAPNNWWHRCNGLLLCRECHSGKFDTMPHRDQLAVKAVRDTECFDLREWIKLGRRPETYLSTEEILESVLDLCYCLTPIRPPRGCVRFDLVAKEVVKYHERLSSNGVDT